MLRRVYFGVFFPRSFCFHHSMSKNYPRIYVLMLILGLSITCGHFPLMYKGVIPNKFESYLRICFKTEGKCDYIGDGGNREKMRKREVEIERERENILWINKIK